MNIFGFLDDAVRVLNLLLHSFEVGLAVGVTLTTLAVLQRLRWVRRP